MQLWRGSYRLAPSCDKFTEHKRSSTPCKAQAALPNQLSLAWFGWLLAIKKRGLVGFWLASGWLLAGFLVGHPPAWKNLVLTWLKLAGPPRCLGAALWRHCPSHKRSKVNGTIPRVGLRSSPGVDRLGRPQKGCASLTRPRLPCQISPLLPGLAGFWLSKKEVWLASGWLLAGFWLPAAWGRPCGGTAPPTNEAK